MKSVNEKMKRNLIFVISVFTVGLIFSFTQTINHSNYLTEKINKASLLTFVGGNKPGKNEVWMKSLAFVPKMKKITVGTKLTWINKDTAMHTVISGTRKKNTKYFKSKNLGKGGKFSYTFKEKGIYKYYCSTHDNMDGVILVQ